MSRLPDVKIQKSFCHLRKCKSEQCRIAGTGNDYIGGLRTTRSNRTCSSWRIKDDTASHIHRQIWNDSLFGDMSVEKAENFCRNPSRDISGKKNCHETVEFTNAIIKKSSFILKYNL